MSDRINELPKLNSSRQSLNGLVSDVARVVQETLDEAQGLSRSWQDEKFRKFQTRLMKSVETTREFNSKMKEIDGKIQDYMHTIDPYFRI